MKYMKCKWKWNLRLSKKATGVRCADDAWRVPGLLWRLNDKREKLPTKRLRAELVDTYFPGSVYSLFSLILTLIRSSGLF